MASTVNFLPWRRARFHQRLRRWGLVVCAIWLLCGAGGWAGWAHWRSERVVNDIHTQAEQLRGQQLAQREKALRAQRQQQVHTQQRLARRRDVESWPSRLRLLAERLPASAWLNTLRYQDRALSLSGTLTQFPALAALDQVLRSLPGFQPGRAGKIQRDKAGRWLFQYQLSQEAPDAP